jgi:hypothetical protein
MAAKTHAIVMKYILPAIISAIASILVAVIAARATISASGAKIEQGQQKAVVAEQAAQAAQVKASAAVQQATSAQQKAEAAVDVSGLPVGSIVASMLAPKDFAAAVGDPSDFDQRTARWTLADNKGPMPGTKWAEITNNQPIPDLRGMFLRGLNVGRDDEWADPEKDRTAGKRQMDELRAHQHTYSDTFVGGSGPAQVMQGGTWARPTAEKETKPTTGAETRPKNVAVYFYIRVR